MRWAVARRHMCTQNSASVSFNNAGNAAVVRRLRSKPRNIFNHLCNRGMLTVH